MTVTSSVVPVGIAGLGRSGWDIHAATLTTMPEKYRIVAACDDLPERREEARTRFGCRPYSQFSEFLADDEVELVAIATPSHLHTDQTIEALQRGKHVIVEKPFAASVADADRMIAAAHETGRILTCNQNSRYTPDFIKVREVIASGRLGRIVLIRIAWQHFSRRWDWQTLKEFQGGLLNNNASHVVDQALLLVGEGEPDVFCHMERTLSSGEAEDHVKIILQAPGKPTIDIEITSACAYPQDTWLIMGTLGGLTGTATRLRWKYVDPALLPTRPVSREPTPDRSYNHEELPWVEETCELPRDGSRLANAHVYQDLYPALREGVPLAITAESVRRQIAVLDTCRRLSPV